MTVHTGTLNQAPRFSGPLRQVAAWRAKCRGCGKPLLVWEGRCLSCGHPVSPYSKASGSQVVAAGAVGSGRLVAGQLAGGAVTGAVYHP